MIVRELMTKNVYTLKKDDTVSKAISLMKEKRFHQIPIVDEEYEGMVFLKELIKSKGDPTRTKLENFIIYTPVLRGRMGIEEAVKILVETGLRALPVVEEDKIVGILSETDVVLKLKIKRFNEINASNIMNRPIVAREEEKLKTILRIMQKNNISSVPLINWKEEVSGCINLFTLANFLYKEKERIESFRLAKERENILNSPAKNFSFFPQIIDKNDTLEKVVTLFKYGEEVIVTENKKPIGIIKPRDVLEILVVKETIPIIVSGVEERENIISFFERKLDKFKKLGVEKIIAQIEKIGARNKYNGKIKIIIKGEILTTHSQAFDIYSLLRDMKEKIEREIEKRKGKIKVRRRKILKAKGE
jgi:predicted transcriptional regulator/ribosome-associated translation inhibitor RaiA